MGFAFEDETGLPLLADPEHLNGHQTIAPPPMDVAPNPSPPSPTVDRRFLRSQQEPAPSTDIEIGNIMLQLQHFADETADEAERKAREVIASAQTEAAEIAQRADDTARHAESLVQAAHAEAQAIVDRAQRDAGEMTARIQPSISPETVVTLSAAVEEFASTNRALLTELTQLRQAIAESYTGGFEHQYPQANLASAPQGLTPALPAHRYDPPHPEPVDQSFVQT